jgi:tRNA G18 (ribose-2'-O)-methylase SpoU
MPIIPVDNPGDLRLAAYRDIRERDLARGNLFVAEGKVVLDVLFSARRFQAQSVLLLESRLRGMAAVLDEAPADLPVYVAPPAVMDAVAGFHIHRGVLAAVKRRPPETADELIAALPAEALVLVLVGISNHDNVGSIFRNAAAFGVDAVLLDRISCDPLYRKAIRVSVGAVLKVPFSVADDAAAIISALDGAGFAQFALSPRGRVEIGEIARPRRVALYLGTEGEGLPESVMASMQTLRIPIASDFDSLNVAAASAIALHRLWRPR